MFQQTVNRQYTTGFAGELVEDGPKRARPGRIQPLTMVNPAATATGPNRISRAFGWAGDVGNLTAVSNPGDVTSGGPLNGMFPTTAARASEVVIGGPNFFGILGHPKHYALYGGVAGDALAPSYDLPDGAVGEFFDMATGLVIEIYNGTGDELDLVYGDLLAYVPNNLSVANNPLGLPAGALVGYKTGLMPTGLIPIPNARIVNAISLPTQDPGALVAGLSIVQLTQ